MCGTDERTDGRMAVMLNAPPGGTDVITMIKSLSLRLKKDY